MFLKRIELQGFKSFADKMTIALEKGVTSIVGPNGSGKSNISDAVRWVLGEQSVKSLRGSRMDDVIFSGTEHRKPSGFAEVTLLLDNQDGGLSVPYAEVAVTRRIYRSGESEYLINKNQCRLKDINEIFFDTGIGREGYSIIGQGKVDEILNNKPEERRGIFEEAAGISKYKARRHEAERKLEVSSQNLVRIRDIISELSVQMEILADQANVARKYLKLRDELKEIEVAGYVASIGKYEALLTKCGTGLAAAEEEHAKLTAALEAAGAASEQIRERSERIDGLQIELNKDVLDIEARLSHADYQINLYREKTARAKTDIDRVRAEIARAGERKTGHGAELLAYKKKLEYLTGELVRFEDLLITKKAEYAGALSVLGESDRAIESLKQEAEEARSKYYEDRNRLSGMQAEREHFIKTAASIEKNLAAVILETDTDNLEKEDLLERQSAFSSEIETLRRKLREQAGKLADIEAAFNAKKSEADKISNDINAKRAKLKILSDMEEGFEGFYSSVRRVLTECKRMPAFGVGIYGAVASLIDVPKELEIAISMALGSAQQNIVTDDEQAVKRAIEFLKKTSGGRATFLPISVIRGRALESDLCAVLATQTGYVGIASELIKYDAKFLNIVRELLGATVVVDTLDNGLIIASRFRYKFRLVTLDGDIIATGGAITGGSANARDSGILGRHRQINDLTIELTRQEAEKSVEEQEGIRLKEVLDALTCDISELEKEHNERRIEHAAIGQRIVNLEEKINSASGRRELYKLELEESKRGAAESDRSISALEEVLKNQAEAIEKTQAGIDAYSAKNREEQLNRDALFSDISAYNVSVASVSETQKAVKENIERLERELADSDRGIASRKAAILRYNDEIDKHTIEIDALRADIGKIEQEKQGAQLRIESAAAEKASLYDETRGLAEETARINGLLSGIGKEINRYEIRAAKLKAEQDHCKNRLWEDYELTYHNALNTILSGKSGGAGESGIAQKTGTTPESGLAQKAGVFSDESGIDDIESAQTPEGEFDKEPGQNPLLIGEAAAKRSAKIREEMNALGPVNVLSIEEYAQTKERYEKMEAQSRDIEEAGGKLEQIISDMSQLMRQKFKERFELINRNFNIVFRELFSGGEARLILSEDKDVLEAGIEIEVQLPGKRMQNMMLYSGGERALTAIALIFAMLMLKQPPFCLLDEIESALDEANVERFTKYINKYSEEIQFIMVTHRKGTMEGSNVLYGVTMQERGVSGVVSLRLSDAS